MFQSNIRETSKCTIDYLNILIRTAYFFPGQYGFGRKRSTNLATIELITKISEAIDKNDYTLGVFYTPKS